jgi:hypothetical protein
MPRPLPACVANDLERRYEPRVWGSSDAPQKDGRAIKRATITGISDLHLTRPIRLQADTLMSCWLEPEGRAGWARVTRRAWPWTLTARTCGCAGACAWLCIKTCVLRVPYRTVSVPASPLNGVTCHSHFGFVPQFSWPRQISRVAGHSFDSARRLVDGAKFRVMRRGPLKPWATIAPIRSLVLPSRRLFWRHYLSSFAPVPVVRTCAPWVLRMLRLVPSFYPPKIQCGKCGRRTIRWLDKKSSQQDRILHETPSDSRLSCGPILRSVHEVSARQWTANYGQSSMAHVEHGHLCRTLVCCKRRHYKGGLR